MNVSFFAGLIFWGMMALVLSELMTLSVANTQAGLVWLSYGLWAGAAVMVIHAGIQALQARRAKRSGVNGHEM
ncbi:hypothetical protein [uncultured Leclercia sp.]|uniref:hypothetical protein n=1 Tax=uncultured Leclercia sp. TaxID=332959 RepID=UPI000501EF08|nr:hypothetical protein [uncultured Leclercia sp.]EIQ7172807.1 hypothetical protein [Escherichia coli]EIQ9904392.1 hypothetical protein [Escherichia coli]KGB10062.1 putative membrane protein [Enterobacteriaceae bacterium ATCC 29904]